MNPLPEQGLIPIRRKVELSADWRPATAGPPLGSGVSQAAAGSARRMGERKISLDRSRLREGPVEKVLTF